MPRELIEPMEFFKIDKISDDVYVIAPNVVLKFNVSLSKVSNGKRYHFHKEYEYPSKNIPNQPTLVTIKRNFDYYFSIENAQKDNNGNKLFIRIGPQEYFLFRKGIETAISWFTSDKYKNLFASNKGKLFLTSPIPEYRISNLPMQKYIELTPTIIDHGMANTDREPGIEITFDDANIIDINLDRLMGLYYIISGFNMYQAALSVVNYLERPEFGTNRFVMESSHTLPSHINERSGSSGIINRFVTPVGSKDNINLLE